MGGILYEILQKKNIAGGKCSLKYCRRGMSVVKRVQHPLGTLLPTSTSPKNAAKKGEFYLH